MCGITGVLNLRGNVPIDPDLLLKANNSMIHRGPDDCGIFVDHEIGLAMRRLSIIDVASGRQPISNENDRIVIVFNGEIYNHKDLRLELTKVRPQIQNEF